MKLIMDIIIIQICVMKHLSWKESTHPPHPLVFSSPLSEERRSRKYRGESCGSRVVHGTCLSRCKRSCESLAASLTPPSPDPARRRIERRGRRGGGSLFNRGEAQKGRGDGEDGKSKDSGGK